LLQVLIQLPHRLHHPQGGAHRALAGVFIRLRVAKVDQQTITQILRDISLIALNHLGTDPLIGPYHLAQLFGVQLCGQGSRIDQIAKQHRELTAFGHGSRAFG
jgi:hypothetical protein